MGADDEGFRLPVGGPDHDLEVADLFAARFEGLLADLIAHADESGFQVSDRPLEVAGVLDVVRAAGHREDVSPQP
ncbi:MAG TPA: hypothetical protein VF574_07550 [Allosphingosinicella sp.]|jgi:hypothetical protein